MTDQSPPDTRRYAVGAMALATINLALLVISIPDYFVSVDSAYHVAMGKGYGADGLYLWDKVNYGPSGRPNLQGPFLHLLIGGLGRLLGGEPRHYVLANTLLAIVQYLVACYTVWHLARCHQSARAALIAMILFTGALFTSISFHIGLPSGWNFLFLAWAVHEFVRGRPIRCALFSSLAIYSHIAGYATVPFAMAVAALLTRRIRPLLIVALVTALLTLPYSVHLFRHRHWFIGSPGSTAMLFDPLLYVLALPGLVLALRTWRDRTFELSFAAAPLPWIITLPSRFMLQSGLAAALLATFFLEWLRARLPQRIGNRLTLIVLVVFYVFPLNAPAWVLGVSWLVYHQPRHVEWDKAAVIAEVIRQQGLTQRLTRFPEASGMGEATAVFVPIRLEDGHWVEVRRRDYGEYVASTVPLNERTYVLPLDFEDRLLKELAQNKVLRYWRAGPDWVVAVLDQRPSFKQGEGILREVFARDVRWLADHAVANVLPVPPRPPWPYNLRPQGECAARILLAFLVFSYASEPASPALARRAYGATGMAGGAVMTLSEPCAANFVPREAVKRARSVLADAANASQRGESVEGLLTRLEALR